MNDLIARLTVTITGPTLASATLAAHEIVPRLAEFAVALRAHGITADMVLSIEDGYAQPEEGE